MGRKEKSVNSATAQTSIISKRTYTRQISNKSINQSNESNLSEINQFVHESTVRMCVIEMYNIPI